MARSLGRGQSTGKTSVSELSGHPNGQYFNRLPRGTTRSGTRHVDSHSPRSEDPHSQILHG